MRVIGDAGDKFTAQSISPIGTQRQLLRCSAMSAIGCKTEVTGTCQSDAIDPNQTSAHGRKWVQIGG